MRHLAAAILAIGALSACSSNSGGNGEAPIAPLTQAQEARFQNTVEEVGRTNTQFGKDKYKENGAHARFASVNPVPPPAISQAEIDERIERDCTMQGLDEMKQPSPTAIDFAIGGAQCPVSLKFSMRQNLGADPNLPNGTMGFSVTFVIVDSQIAHQYDVQAFDISMQASIQSQQSQNSGSATATIKGQGTIKSRKEGLVKIALAGGMNASGNANSFRSQESYTLTMTYPDGLRVELKETKSNENGTQLAQCFLNDKEITAEECSDVKSKLDMDDAGQETERAVAASAY